MEFNEDIDPTVNRYTLDDLEEGMEVYADIGEYVTDIRAATIDDIHEEDRSISLSLGPSRMDGPYVVPIDRVHDIAE